MIKQMWIREGQQPTTEQIAELDTLESRDINLDDIPEISAAEIDYVKNMKKRRCIRFGVA